MERGQEAPSGQALRLGQGFEVWVWTRPAKEVHTLRNCYGVTASQAADLAGPRAPAAPALRKTRCTGSEPRPQTSAAQHARPLGEEVWSQRSPVLPVTLASCLPCACGKKSTFVQAGEPCRTLLQAAVERGPGSGRRGISRREVESWWRDWPARPRAPCLSGRDVPSCLWLPW